MTTISILNRWPLLSAVLVVTASLFALGTSTLAADDESDGAGGAAPATTVGVDGDAGDSADPVEMPDDEVPDSKVPQGDGEIEIEPFIKPSAKELRKRLTAMQFKVTQNANTEPAFRNAYWANKAAGNYHCIICDQPLFAHRTKFKSGTGWPSFYAPIDAKLIGTQTDYKMIYPRTEVHCSRCKSHLGHVFGDGPAPTGLRYCLNSAAMDFKPEEK